MIKVTLYLDRVTKGTHRFAEQKGPNRPAIGTIYITKEELAKQGMLNATKIDLTLTANDYGEAQ